MTPAATVSTRGVFWKYLWIDYQHLYISLSCKLAHHGGPGGPRAMTHLLTLISYSTLWFNPWRRIAISNQCVKAFLHPKWWLTIFGTGHNALVKECSSRHPYVGFMLSGKMWKTGVVHGRPKIQLRFMS